jgi:hypothetical protein
MSVLTYSKRLCVSAAAAVALAGTLLIATASPAAANHNNYGYDRWSDSGCYDCGSSYYAPTYYDHGRRYRRSYHRGYYDDCFDRGYYRGSRGYYRESYYHDPYRYRGRHYGRGYYSGYYGY